MPMVTNGQAIPSIRKQTSDNETPDRYATDLEIRTIDLNDWI